MDWNIKKNRKYLLLLVFFCAVVPHVALSLLKRAFAVENLAPIEIEYYSKFFVCEWMPFFAALIAYLRLQKMDKFSLLPCVCVGVILLTYLPRFSRNSIMAVALVLPLMLAMECTAVLSRLESSGMKLLAGIGTDRRMLRAFGFWSIEFPAVALIACKASAWHMTAVSPFLMLPIPAVLLFEVFRHQKSQPPTAWGVAAMLLLVPVSLYLVTIGPMEKFMIYHLMSLVSGFVVLFLMLIVYNMDRWRKAKTER